MTAQTKFADNATTTLGAAIATTPSAGTSEAWLVASTAAPMPAVATGTSQAIGVLIPGPTNTTFGSAGAPDPTPEIVLITNTNDGTHFQVQRGYGGTIKTHQSGDILAVCASATWLTAVDALVVAAGVADVVTINTQTTSYTLVLGDASDLVEMNSASATVVTIPTNASVAFPIGTVIGLRRYGAGSVTITPAGGVTLDSPGGLVTLASQYSSGSLHKRATNEWVLSGSLA